METRFFGRGARLVTLVLVITSTLAAASEYHVIKRIPIPGDSGWDYITADSEGRRLYVPHGAEVVVLNLDSGEIVGRISGQKGVHGVAIAQEFRHGFISATDPGSVTMFDLQSLAVLNKERVGDDPNGIIYDPLTKRVFTADRGSKRLTSIDAKTGKVAGTIDDLGGRTEHLAADLAGHVFLNMQDVGKLHKLDVRTFKIAETWKLTPTCAQPSSMDMDIAHNRLFIGCRGGSASQPPAPTLFAVVDASSGKIVTTQPIGPGVDALEFDPAKGLIYVSTGGDKWGSIHLSRRQPGQILACAELEDLTRSANYGTRPQDRHRVSASRRHGSSADSYGREPSASPQNGSRIIFSFGGRAISRLLYSIARWNPQTADRAFPFSDTGRPEIALSENTI
jgi:hypothetical protein